MRRSDSLAPPITQATGAGGRTLDSFKCWLSGGVQDIGEPVVEELLLRDADSSAMDWKLQARLQVGEKLPPLRAPANRGPVAPRGSRALGTRAAKKAEPRPTYTEFTKRQEAQLTAQLLLLRFLGEGGDFGSIPPSKLLGDAMNTAIEARASQNNTARKRRRRPRRAAGGGLFLLPMQRLFVPGRPRPFSLSDIINMA